MKSKDICYCNEVFVLNKHERVANEYARELIQRYPKTNLSNVANDTLFHGIRQLDLVFSEASHQILVSQYSNRFALLVFYRELVKASRLDHMNCF